ncbi:MAG: hypothetical protein AM326_00095 [Candidatus Thorarchaeota archaeon SMTZ-45]|nr:MAG: hypothetical protein AM326_00095 [Candidatus Thorarchaeota archaeon SMTZ-45]
MVLKQKFLIPVVSLIFILLASFVLSGLLVDYKYLKYEDRRELYLNSNDDPLEINIKIKNGTIIELITQRLSGDLDLGIEILIKFNSSYQQRVRFQQETSFEYVTWKFVSRPPERGIGFFSEYPFVILSIIPISGSGLFSLSYRVLQPTNELPLLSILIMIVGVSFLLKDLIKTAKAIS